MKVSFASIWRNSFITHSLNYLSVNGPFVPCRSGWERRSIEIEPASWICSKSADTAGYKNWARHQKAKGAKHYICPRHLTAQVQFLCPAVIQFGAGYNFCPRHTNLSLKKIIDKDKESKTNYSQPAGYKWAIDWKINLSVRQEPYPSGQKSYDGNKNLYAASQAVRTDFVPVIGFLTWGAYTLQAESNLSLISYLC